MTAERNKQVIRELYEEVFCGHDLSTVDRYIHDDYIQHNPHAAQGKAGFVEFHKVFFQAIPDARTTITMMVAEGISFLFTAPTRGHIPGTVCWAFHTQATR